MTRRRSHCHCACVTVAACTRRCCCCRSSHRRISNSLCAVCCGSGRIGEGKWRRSGGHRGTSPLTLSLSLGRPSLCPRRRVAGRRGLLAHRGAVVGDAVAVVAVSVADAVAVAAGADCGRSQPPGRMAGPCGRRVSPASAQFPAGRAAQPKNRGERTRMPRSGHATSAAEGREREGQSTVGRGEGGHDEYR